jgi:hypothetical protein
VGAGAGNATVLLIGYDLRHTTSIGRGENSGRTLQEANIVRSIQTLGPWQGAALDLRAPHPQADRAVVVVQADDGTILGAARTED